ncbi:hypothetical protein OHA74_14355 [Streptomyces phaeochromogenes]|uniref:hypothetical protein n=1 Tax=Streptomyces phaeochromogenes TaxID=1923 RepID=UPI002E2D0A67|nr:hypothetical protein [Streptomyces phaeochromogenes]
MRLTLFRCEERLEDTVGDPPSQQASRFLGRVMFETDPAIRRLFGTEVAPVEGQYLDALLTALPHLPPDEVAFRYRAMAGLLGLHQSGSLGDLRPGRPAEAVEAADVETERLIRLLTAGLQAPAATS